MSSERARVRRPSRLNLEPLNSRHPPPSFLPSFLLPPPPCTPSSSPPSTVGEAAGLRAFKPGASVTRSRGRAGGEGELGGGGENGRKVESGCGQLLASHWQRRIFL